MIFSTNSGVWKRLHFQHWKSFFITIFFIFSSAASLQAAVFTVTNNSGGTGVGSLRWAMDQAVLTPGADTIVFSQDTTIEFVGGARAFYFDDQGLTIDNNGYTVIIDGSQMTGDATWPQVGFLIGDSNYYSGGGAWGRLAGNITINGIIIRNAQHGGILVNNGAYNINLVNCTFINNGDEPIRIDGSSHSFDGTQQVTGISVNGASFLSNGRGILLTQTANHQQLVSYIWSNYQAGILPLGDGQASDMATFLDALGNGRGDIALATNPLTSGMIVINNGVAEAIILNGSYNEITNFGTTGIIVGSYNETPGSNGGANSIVNYGNAGIIIGSFNEGAGSTSDGNTIINYGYVGGDIWGSINTGAGSRGGNDIIVNAGTVAGSIFGNDGNDTVIFYRGSILRGIADGGTGEDTLVFYNIGFHDITSQNFENVEIHGSYGVKLGPGYLINPLRVTGDASIHDGRLSVSLLRALYPDGQKWAIISGADIDGRFSSIKPLFTSYTINLRQTVMGGTLGVEIDRTPYSIFGDTINQSAVGSALNALLPTAYGTMEDLLVTMDFGMIPDQIRATLSGLNPEFYTSFPTAGLETASVFSRATQQRQNEKRLTKMFPGDEPEPPGWDVWTRLIGTRFDQDNIDSISGYDLESSGVIFGIDRRFNFSARAGMLLGYSNGDLDWDQNNSSGKITGKHIGIYGSIDCSGLYINGYAGYSDLDNSTAREVITPVFQDIAFAEFDSSVLSGSFTIGSDMSIGPLYLGPAFSINYQYLNQNAFHDSGNQDFNQKFEEDSQESLSSLLALNINSSIKFRKWHYRPRASVGWLHQFENNPVILQSAFSSYPAARFSITGTESAQDLLLLTAGMETKYGSNLSLFADYSLVNSNNQQSQMLSCGLSWQF